MSAWRRLLGPSLALLAAVACPGNVPVAAPGQSPPPATVGAQTTATETTTAGGNLELHLFALEGNTLFELAGSTAIGPSAQALSAPVVAGETILVEVKGQNSAFGRMTQGAFTLGDTLA